jgi:hypothetical protein
MKTFTLLAVAALTFAVSFQASAQEIGPGAIAGQSALLEVMTSRYFNLTNENCIRETIQKAPMRDAMISIGMRITSINLIPAISPQTGAAALSLTLTYSGERAQNTFSEAAGSCELRN